jgi:MFS family permease
MNLREYRQATEITSFFVFCIFLFNPVLAPYIKSLGVSDFHLGLMFALFPLTLILSSSLFGSLSDKVGRKKIIIFGIVLELVGVMLYLFGNWQLMIIARVLEALAFAAVIFVGFAKVQDSLKSKSRGKYSGRALTLMQVGKIIAPVMGGYLADYWFIKAPFIFSAFALLVMLWLISIHEDMHFNHKFSRSDFNLIQNLRRFLSDRRLKGMALLGIVMHASLPISIVFIPIYIVEHFALPYRFVGYALFAMQFFMLFQFYIGSLCDRFNRAKLILFGVAIHGIAFILLAFMPGYWSFISVLLFLSIGGGFWNVAAWAFMSDIGEKTKSEGFIIGSYVSIAKIGSFLVFVFGGLIVQNISVNALILLVGVLILLGCIGASFLILEKKAKQRGK